jgi:hypothetical protein
MRYNSYKDPAVGKRSKFFERLMKGQSDSDLRFDDLCQLLVSLGFSERVRGDHHIFTKDGMEEILNLQPKGAQAKTYQVKQVRELINKYRLNFEDEA